MAETKDFGPFYFMLAHFAGPSKKVIGLLPSTEIEPPFRQGISLFVRIPILNVGGVFGIWGKVLDEEKALMAAMHGWGYDIHDEDLTDPEVRETVRRIVAENIEDLDEEWQVVSMLGLDGDDIPYGNGEEDDEDCLEDS